VTVLSDANGGTLGLAENDVFYFGNAIGDTGNTGDNTFVNITDELGPRNHPHTFLDPAAVDDAYDYNHDHFVNITDELLARNNATNFLTALKLITVPAAGGEGASSMAMAGSGYSDQDGDSTTATATKDGMAVLSSEPVEPLAASASSDVSASSNLLMGTHASFTVQTFEGNTEATRLTDASEETVDLLADIGTSDVNLELAVLNDLNADSFATGDGQAGLWASQAAEAEAGDDTASAELPLDSILDELEPLEIPDLRQLAPVS
jgi:hypothetical protein